MKTSGRIQKALGCLVAVASAANLALAGTSVDLSRETPVPATEPVPIVDFVRPPILREPQLNLAGTHIAAIISTAQDHSELIVCDLQTQQFDRIGGHGDNDIFVVRWLDSNRLIYNINSKGRGNFGWIAADVGALHSAYPLLQFVGSSLIAVPPGDRLHPVVHIISNTSNTGKYGEVAVIRTDRFRAQIAENGVGFLPADARQVVYENNVRHIVSRYPVLETIEGGDYRYLADREGKLAFGFVQDEGGRIALYRLDGTFWRQCPVNLEAIEVFGTGDNPGEIVVLGERKDGKPRALEVMDAASGKVLNVLWQDPAYDFEGRLYRDPKSNRIIGAIGNKSGPFSVWFDEGMRELQRKLDKMFPGQVVRIIGNDEAGKIFLVSTFSDRQPASYSWVNLEKRTAGLFKNPVPWIDPQRMQPMSVMKYKTRDGKQFDAYVTLPKGATRENPPPLVVLPDGRTAWGFSAEAQFLASRGYAVLQPNYRGLPGYNWQYPEEDEWAYRKMHEDVTDATQALIATGLVDRNRVAIVGSRFDGYLALCGVAFEPSLYRCAVAISAVCDYGRIIEDQKYYQNRGRYYDRMRLKLGDPKQDSQKFDEMSPLKHAGAIRAPILISEGENDLSVELAMAADLVSTMKKNGVDAESIKFMNEGEGVRFLDHRVELFGRIETFLARNLAPAAR